MTINYYELLGLKPDYDIDRQKLTQSYRELQRIAHPDKFTNASDQVKRLSIQKSALINDAFQTLKDPVKRAIYQLSLLGVEIKDNETSMDGEFLMQQMMLREELEQISKQKDSLNKLVNFQNKVEDEFKLFINKLSQLFANSETAETEEIKTTILKMQFFNKLIKECEDIEEAGLNLY